MRRDVRIGTITVLCSLLIPTALPGMDWSINPGLYLNYEYSDNYYGVREDEVSESTYRVGPSLGVLATDQFFTWSLTGHLAREYHKRNHEERDTEASLETRLNAMHEHHTVDLGYSYAQTRTRESLDAQWGEHRIHTGDIAWDWALAPHHALTLGYTKRVDQMVSGGSEDLESDGGRAAWRSQVNPHNSVEISGSYETIQYEPSNDAPVGYEVSEDISTLTGDLRWRHAVSPALGTGALFSYGKDTPEETSWLKTYAASVFLDYIFNPQLSATISGGHSWLKPETGDTDETTIADAGLTYRTERDTLSCSVSHAYTHEYTTGETYGIYKTLGARAMLEHFFSRAWVLSLASDYTKRESTSGIDAPDEITTTQRAVLRYHLGPDLLRASSLSSAQETSTRTDASQPEQEDGAGNLLGRFPALGWRRTSSLDVLFSYTHLEHEIEDLETIRENRYGVSIEVRY